MNKLCLDKDVLVNMFCLFAFSLLGGYDDHDSGPDIPDFKPKLPPGLQLPARTREEKLKFTTPLDFFKLFFTVDLVTHLCEYTNNYARIHGPRKPTLYKRWDGIEPSDFYDYIGVLMYMAVVEAPNIELYWSTAPLFHGLWARHFMSKLKFKAMQSFLKVCNAETENNAVDKLCKVRFLHDYIRRKCMKLWQPYEHVAVDERMVRNRGRFTFRQFVKDKPTRWGMKLWVLADSSNGYTYDFEVYTGKGAPVSKNGLAYDVVMRLCKSLEKQGYKVFFDNFYSGVQLLKDLLTNGTVCCGTLLTNRKGVPTAFKDTKVFAKGPRGQMRWKREGNLLFLQWLDNKSVTFISTVHKKANLFGHVKRRTKVNGQYRPIYVRQPKIVEDYNKFMSGVDKSDQLLGKYETLRKTHRWWKTLFYHFVDISRVNSYLMFKDWMKKNPDMPELQRPASYGQLDFTVELIRQLGGIDDNTQVPLYKKPQPQPPTHVLVPTWSNDYKNCKLCYKKYKKEQKTYVICGTCKLHYCFTKQRNCLLESHSSQ